MSVENALHVQRQPMSLTAKLLRVCDVRPRLPTDVWFRHKAALPNEEREGCFGLHTLGHRCRSRFVERFGS